MVAALVLLGSGCSSEAIVGQGPLGPPGDPGEVCIPVPAGGTASVGLDVLRNRDAVQATIEEVTLFEPKGVTVVGALAVPLSGTDSVGIAATFPPADPTKGLRGIEWSARREAVGATVSRDGSPQNLIVGIRPQGGEGSASAIDVRYSAGGKTYHFRSSTKIVLRVAPLTCS